MFRPFFFGSLLAFLLTGCDSSSKVTANPAEQYLTDPNSVGFDIQPLPRTQNSSLRLATYTAQGKTARFRIELNVARPLDDKESKEFDIQSGQGKLLLNLDLTPVFF